MANCRVRASQFESRKKKKKKKVAGPFHDLGDIFLTQGCSVNLTRQNSLNEAFALRRPYSYYTRDFSISNTLSLHRQNPTASQP